MRQQFYKESKFLSLILRHKPEKIGLELDKNGWVSTELLLKNLNKSGFKLDLSKLKQIVFDNDKQRFAFNDDYSKIRANQGHSLRVELNYEPVKPPKNLYHGTATRFLDSIYENGIQKQKRHHVHLSLNIETAKNVGSRYGKTVVLIIDAEQMHQDGFEFFESENGIWLVDKVPSKYIQERL